MRFEGILTSLHVIGCLAIVTMGKAAHVVMFAVDKSAEISLTVDPSTAISLCFISFVSCKIRRSLKGTDTPLVRILPWQEILISQNGRECNRLGKDGSFITSAGRGLFLDEDLEEVRKQIVREFDPFQNEEETKFFRARSHSRCLTAGLAPAPNADDYLVCSHISI